MKGTWKTAAQTFPFSKASNGKGTKTSSKYIKVYSIAHCSSKYEGISKSKISKPGTFVGRGGGMHVQCVTLERVASKYFYMCKTRFPTTRLYQNPTISLRTTKASSLSSMPRLTRCSALLSTWIHFILLVCILLSLHWSCGFEFSLCIPHELFIQFPSSPGNRALKKASNRTVTSWPSSAAARAACSIMCFWPPYLRDGVHFLTPCAF